jgi:hypothetical protein
MSPRLYLVYLLALAPYCITATACAAQTPHSMNAAMSPQEAQHASSRSGEVFLERLAPSALGDPGRASADGRTPMVSGRATVVGSLARDAVERAAYERQRDVEVCYASARRARPSLEGSVTLQFTAAADGAVRDMQIVSAEELPFTLVNCVRSELSKVVLPPQAGGGTSVLYVLNFSLVAHEAQ